MRRATELDDVKRYLSDKPLPLDQLDDYFVETAHARDALVSHRGELSAKLDSDDNVKVLVAGDRGTGKSTELTKFRQEYGDRFAVVVLDLLEEAVIGSVTIESLLVLIVERLLDAVRKLGGEWDEENLRRIYHWFSETFRYDEKTRESSAKAGGGVSVDDTWWSKLVGLSGFLKLDVTTGARVLNKTITKENRRLGELVANCDLLVKDARIALMSKLHHDLLLVVENLDKVGLREAHDVFLANPRSLTRLSCKAIFTAPTFLLHSPNAGLLRSHFERVTLPMIEVTDRDDAPNPRGRDVVVQILDRRIDLERLCEPEAVDLAIAKTGGILAHLFEVLSLAALAAEEAQKRGDSGRDQPRIVTSDVRYALTRLRRELVNSLTLIGLPEQFDGITAPELKQRLVELRDEVISDASDRLSLYLLWAQALVGYNGDGWYRLHPLIAEYVATLAET